MRERKNWRGVRILRFDGFQEFVDHLVTMHAQTHNIVWRGQRNAKWRLSDSLLRFARMNLGPEFEKNQPIVDEQRRQDGVRAMKSFTRRLGQHVSNKDALNFEQRWAMIQHYGGVSPLLDWTRSPFVAAFFALADAVRTEGQYPHGRMAVWGLKRTNVQLLIQNAQSGDTLEWVDDPMPHNQRVLAQQGLFSKFSAAADLDRWLMRHDGFNKLGQPVLEKHIVPLKDAMNSLTILHRMNINFATLFPDLEGTARHSTLSAASPGYEGLPNEGSL